MFGFDPRRKRCPGRWPFPDLPACRRLRSSGSRGDCSSTVALSGRSHRAPAPLGRDPHSKTHLTSYGTAGSPCAFHRVPRVRPSIDLTTGVHSRGPKPTSVEAMPRPRSRSVLVVSHHLDGFLLRRLCGLVASRCQSWGPPGFGAPTWACLPRSLRFPTDARPSRAFPSRASRTRVTAGRCPLVVPPTASRRPARPRGLAPTGSPWRRPSVARRGRSMLSWVSHLKLPRVATGTGGPKTIR